MHIHSGHNALIESFFQVFGSAMQVVHVFNVHPVAHDKAFEAPFVSQDIIH